MDQPKISYSAGGIIVNSRGQVLLVCENGNFWGLPKGHIEEGEDALAAAIREIKEEAGLDDPTPIRSLGVYERHPFLPNNTNDMSELKKIEIFLFQSDQEEMHPIELNTTVAWIPIKKASSTLTHPADKKFFASVQNQLK